MPPCTQHIRLNAPRGGKALSWGQLSFQEGARSHQGQARRHVPSPAQWALWAAPPSSSVPTWEPPWHDGGPAQVLSPASGNLGHPSPLCPLHGWGRTPAPHPSRGAWRCRQPWVCTPSQQAGQLVLLGLPLPPRSAGLRPLSTRQDKVLTELTGARLAWGVGGRAAPRCRVPGGLKQDAGEQAGAWVAGRGCPLLATVGTAAPSGAEKWEGLPGSSGPVAPGSAACPSGHPSPGQPCGPSSGPSH